jgi:hypothetical protein
VKQLAAQQGRIRPLSIQDVSAIGLVAKTYTWPCKPLLSQSPRLRRECSACSRMMPPPDHYRYTKKGEKGSNTRPRGRGISKGFMSGRVLNSSRAYTSSSLLYRCSKDPTAIVTNTCISASWKVAMAQLNRWLNGSLA